MKDLQSFDFDKSQYERANQKWECGNRVNGKTCPQGPDGRGKCQASAECKPNKNGDRWECTRSLLHGGKCEHGPQGNGNCYHQIPPCKPARSLRSKRAIHVISFALICFVLVGAFSFTPLRDQMISPGPLSAKHSAKAQSCDSCHDKKTNSPANWFAMAVADHNSADESACVRCHKIGDTSNNPHNLTLEKLKSVKVKMQETLKDDVVKRFIMFSGSPKTLQCYSCHREHRGKQANLTNVSNIRCINCHVSQHADFKNEHPDFVNFAYDRRTRLRFDHGKHFEDYFKDEKFVEHAPESCGNCHKLDAKQGVMVSGSFKDGCLRCHKNDTTAEDFTEKGVVFFGLPSLDLETLNANNISIGQWPDGLEDEEITPLMLFLLSANEQLIPLLDRIASADLNLAELEGESDDTLRLVGELVWQMKDLFLDMANKSSRWLSLVERLSDQRLNAVSRSAVENFLPGQQLNRALSIWIPNLSIEKVLRNRGKRLDTKLVPVDFDLLQTDGDTVRPGRWYIQGYTVLYRPKGHNDDFLRTWLELSQSAISSNNKIAVELLKYLSHKDSPGQCMRCHSIDETNGTVVLNWKARNKAPEDRLFTVFSHAPHMKVLKQDQCDTCHRINEDADYSSGFKDNNPLSYQSNFVPVEKKTCAQCHTASKVGDTCVTCHKYHLAKTVRNVAQAKQAFK